MTVLASPIKARIIKEILTEAEWSALDPILYKGETVNVIKGSFITTKTATADGLRYSQIPYLSNEFQGAINVESMGAKGDGVTDDSAAVELALSFGDTVFFGIKNYLFSSSVAVPSTAKILGCGQRSILKTNNNIPIFILGGNQIEISGVNFIGSGKDSGKTNQTGIYFNQRIQNLIHNCRFQDLGGAGIKGDETVQGFDGNNFTSNIAFNCNVGYHFMNRCEYNQLVNCSALSNNTGVIIVGGNNSVVGCNISNNKIGIDIQAGDNDGHGIITGNKINHNLDFSIKVGAITSYTIANNMMFYGVIQLTGSLSTRFFGNEIFCPQIICDGALDCYFTNNRFASNTTVTQNANGNPSRVFFSNNTNEGLNFTGGRSWNIKGGLESRFVTGSINVAAANSPYTIPFASFSARFISNNLSYTLDNFYNGTTDRFINKGYNGGDVTISGKIQIQYTTFSSNNNNLSIEIRIYSDATGSTLQGTFKLSPTFFDGVATFNLNQNIQMGANTAFEIVLLTNSSETVTILGGGNSAIDVEGL